MRVLHIIPRYRIVDIESLIMSLYRNIDKSIVQFELLTKTQKWLHNFEELTQRRGKVYQINPLNYINYTSPYNDSGSRYFVLDKKSILSR